MKIGCHTLDAVPITLPFKSYKGKKKILLICYILNTNNSKPIVYNQKYKQKAISCTKRKIK